MPKTLDWKRSDDPRDLVHIAVQAIVEGRLVVLPAETAYHVFASGLNSDAVLQLSQLAEQGKTRAPCIFLRSPQEALDYSPSLSQVANRVVNRGWPGPLVLELPAIEEKSLVHNLPESVRSKLLVEGKYLPQRVAAHEAIVQTMRLLPGPLVAAAMLDADGNAICNGIDAAKSADKNIVAVVNDGTTHHGGFATTIRIDGADCEIVAKGVVELESAQRLSQLMVLLVCTGNTCRSPMAEVLLRDMLCRRFPERFQNPHAPALIMSAGLSAFPGGPASTEAINVMKKRGLNLQAHQSHSITERALRHADLVLAMTNSHRMAILERMPELESKVYLLSGENSDVSDPFGGPESAYAACAVQLEEYLEIWLSRIEESWFPKWRFEVD